MMIGKSYTSIVCDCVVTCLLAVSFLVLLVIFPASTRSQDVTGSADKTVGPTLNTASSAGQPNAQMQSRIAASYGHLPLAFELNQGQTDPRVKFLSRGSGYTLFLTGDETLVELRRLPSESDKGERSAVLGMRLAGAKRSSVNGDGQLPGKTNYFIGNEQTKWRTNIPSYGRVEYHGVYPGIDLVYYGNQGQLEYDFVVAPGGDPGAIRLVLDDYSDRALSRSRTHSRLTRLDANGDLIVGLNGGEVRLQKPVIYQASRTGDSARIPIDGRF